MAKRRSWPYRGCGWNCPVCNPTSLVHKHRTKKLQPDPELHQAIKEATRRQRPVAKK